MVKNTFNSRINPKDCNICIEIIIYCLLFGFFFTFGYTYIWLHITIEDISTLGYIPEFLFPGFAMAMEREKCSTRKKLAMLFVFMIAFFLGIIIGHSLFYPNSPKCTDDFFDFFI